MTLGEFIVSRWPSIYPQVLPQGVSTGVTYTQVSRSATHAFGGDATTIQYRVQIDVWADTYGEAKALAAAVREAFSRYRSEEVQDVLLVNEVDSMEDGTRRVSQDYFIYIEEV